MNFNYNKTIIVINSCKDADMSDEALSFYEQFFPELKKDIPQIMRGDTMCSFGWTFGEENEDSGCFVKCRSYTKSFTTKEIEIFNSFKKGYHSLPNFWIFPKILNNWRGYNADGCDGENQNDYFDIFLNLVRDYYLEKEKLSSKIVETFNKCEKWLNQYGTHHIGWVEFINKSFLNPFVNINYTVKDLFSKPDEFKLDNAPVVGSHHGYGWGLPGYTIDPKQNAINYAMNSLYIWKQRTELLIDCGKR